MRSLLHLETRGFISGDYFFGCSGLVYFMVVEIFFSKSDTIGNRIKKRDFYRASFI